MQRISMKTELASLLVIAIILVSGCAIKPDKPGVPSPTPDQPNQDQIKAELADLKKFTSTDEITGFLKNNSKQVYAVDNLTVERPAIVQGTSGIIDIFRSEGKYIYKTSTFLSENEGQSRSTPIVIQEVTPKGTAVQGKVLATIEINGIVKDIIINKDRLVVFYYMSSNPFIKVFDVSDRSRPVLKRDIKLEEGYYYSTFMKSGDWVYFLAERVVHRDDLKLSSEAKGQPEVYYLDVPSASYMFTFVGALNTAEKDDQEISSKTFLLPLTYDIFVSANNIYIFYQELEFREKERTYIYKISVSGSEIRLVAKGEIPGRLLGQFSRDEFERHFRIFTITAYPDERSLRNNLYVLDEDLKTVGKLEDLAPGESVDARFEGEMAYITRYGNKFDQLAVIDLKDPKRPKILGQ